MKVICFRGGKEGKPQKSSNVTRRSFPFGSLRVPMILVPGNSWDFDIVVSNGIADKIALIENRYRPDDGDVLLAPWPGHDMQDVFVIDDVDAALVALKEAL